MKSVIATALIGCSLILATLPCVAQDQPTPTKEDANTAFRKQLAELNWIRGPQQVQLFGNSTLDVPAGYVFLNPSDTAKLETITHNIGGGTEYFLAPQDLSWGAHFSFQNDGYVKDDEKIDAAALLQNIRDNTAAANKIRRERGWDEMEVIGWQAPPHYDTTTNRLEWAVSGRDLKSNSEVVNFNTRILGRGGVMSAVLIAEPQDLSAATNDFKSALSGFAYSAGQRYAEYRPGDKVAKYGLAALVTGGAAAIAVKTGLWKVIVGAVVAGWKFVAAALVALFGGLAKWFKRKTA
ncbi:MAG TPA: DUF2167 domain-containing protein [Steroidobacteraceae bacterium]|jgi:uncharacterized membrane-anchored protein|nr:DUF2167 domain-containing protein [Steroidobacteraceae bacterium]